MGLEGKAEKGECFGNDHMNCAYRAHPMLRPALNEGGDKRLLLVTECGENNLGTAKDEI